MDHAHHAETGAKVQKHHHIALEKLFHSIEMGETEAFNPDDVETLMQ